MDKGFLLSLEQPVTRWWVLVCCIGCSSAADPADAGVDASMGLDSTLMPEAAKLSNLCCQQAGLQQTCTEDYSSWSCVDQTWSYACTTPLCTVGQYCVGVDGPGEVVSCP